MNVSASQEQISSENFQNFKKSFLLDIQHDPDHNRHVLTIASFSLKDLLEHVKIASELILENTNYLTHVGVHPKVGTIDVVPFVSYDENTQEPTKELIETSISYGEWIKNKFSIEPFYYDYSSKNQKSLPEVRKQIRSLDVTDSEHGHVCVGARKPLIAINVNLKSSNIEIAKIIAKKIRGESGGIKNVRALAFELKSKNIVQVSMNIVDAKETNCEQVIGEVRQIATQHSIDCYVELIGLVPNFQYELWSEEFITWSGLTPDCVIENRLKKFSI